jgi:hypothetical protein
MRPIKIGASHCTADSAWIFSISNSVNSMVPKLLTAQRQIKRFRKRMLIKTKRKVAEVPLFNEFRPQSQ